MNDFRYERISILEDRAAYASKGDKVAVEECNRKLRAINCEIQGIRNPDDVKEEPELTRGQKSAATRKRNAEKGVLG